MITVNSNNFKYKLTEKNNNPIESMIQRYYIFIDSNQFDDMFCPCCKQKGYLHFHKTYERNLVYKYNNQVISTKINIAVLECINCKKKENKQKYHALLPDFIFPYHIYEASSIVTLIYLRLIKEQKIEELLNGLGITHKLYYDWLYKFKKYSLISSIILKVTKKIKTVIRKIYNLNQTFLIDFYQYYSHPFFLFKKTCVPLCLTP